MKQSAVDPACTSLFSPLFLDYLDQKEALAPFYSFFPTLANFGQAVRDREFSAGNREVLADELTRQYQGIAERGAVDGQIALLRQDRTFTVTTGHQLNLMTGPLYFIYKIVSTINLAKKLKDEYPQYEFIPVYWMASEDHDFAEINHFVFEGKKYTWESNQAGPVGAFQIDPALKALIGDMRFLPDFFRQAYLESATLAEAVRKYVHHLFGAEGLLVLDANSAPLKRLFASVIEDDLLTQRANELVKHQNERLESLGYKTQIYPREINFFYMKEGLRDRIIRSGSHFEVVGTEISWTKEELLGELNSYPERFSPNVVMRPLYQEVILPNIAYLGGPAEVAYWFQLKGVFDHYRVDYPAVMPRNFGVIVPKVASRKIKALGLSKEDLFKSFDELRIAYTITHADGDVLLGSEQGELEELFGRLQGRLSAADPTLGPAVLAAKERGLRILLQLSVKFRKVEERKQQESIRRLREIKEALFPGGAPQERRENFLNFYLGNEAVISEFLSTFDPLDFRVVVMELDD
ncbi:MAG: bacillithiol biosynthesis cysteine-adding enzyme BshC [Lunatimonas sp.]|uniref:bacillithiol biosynthesis cysteine-adding enzyme BshC n=1 Tax=Lunatimonas sp. TaxID=2060141 RepID=UPI00263B5DB5|nr:bacillithiol biosynthesis cysteine-adding enzyme BshC [Lunatimonas sp.]MCC5937833.1 bacillithiol biosynthesis cysteine-adding enzyme BshC [Lunatimonas sp.]